MARRRGRKKGLNLSAPKVATFVIAVALMVLAAIAYYTEAIDMEVNTAFLLLALGGGLLTLANMVGDL